MNYEPDDDWRFFFDNDASGPTPEIEFITNDGDFFVTDNGDFLITDN